MAFVLTTDDRDVPISCLFTDTNGAESDLTDMTWESSDPSIMTVELAPTNGSAFLSAVGPVGEVKLTVAASMKVLKKTVNTQAVLEISVIDPRASNPGWSAFHIDDTTLLSILKKKELS